MDKIVCETFAKVGREITGPALFNFVKWILEESVQRNIHVLYFLARDGYILREIAEYLVSTYRLPIICKYLYCSRSSLRMPTYHFVGEEAFDLLSLGGYCVTLNSLLERANLNVTQRVTVLEECGLLGQPCASPLSKTELSNVTQRLRDNSYYRECVIQNSKNAYPAAMGYLRQEGLFNGSQIAIVDSGWTGSMQRSLRQLLESGNYSGTITGFYFGLYESPKEIKDGNYQAWYFSRQGKSLDKALFCNNLFECILSAPHGMTHSYKKEGELYIPVLLPGPTAKQLEMIEVQIDSILQGVKSYKESVDRRNIDSKKQKNNIRKQIHRFMARPSLDEVSVYGTFMFNDDVNDLHHVEIANSEQIRELDSYLVHKRLMRKLGNSPPIQELFWPYGVTAFLPKWKHAWYRWNIFTWEIVKYLLK